MTSSTLILGLLPNSSYLTAWSYSLIRNNSMTGSDVFKAQINAPFNFDLLNWLTLVVYCQHLHPSSPITRVNTFILWQVRSLKPRLLISVASPLSLKMLWLQVRPIIEFTISTCESSQHIIHATHDYRHLPTVDCCLHHLFRLEKKT